MWSSSSSSLSSVGSSVLDSSAMGQIYPGTSVLERAVAPGAGREAGGALDGLARPDDLEAAPDFVLERLLQRHPRLLVRRAAVGPQTQLREVGQLPGEGHGCFQGLAVLHEAVGQPH